MTAPARGQMDELLDVVSQLVDRVLALEEQGARRTTHRTDRPGTPFRWENLDPDRLRSTWQEFGDWVRWLTERFRIDDIPPCWYRHGDLVEELTGLWLAWQAAYHDDRPDDPVRWLDWLARARARFARRSPRCGAGTHKEHGVGPIHDDSDFAAFVARQSTRATTAAAAGS
ncbi:conserved hypothetical protein [Frankia canadensis]|uniref:DUF4913 domain-containing protein n=1 Tax=Frankia canadensis TaxID=1836972 RepID=A0A2I2KQT9_9ACTN|nr:hypothetical protein [Frankia canadensis]SNQ48032.1 conserved hypothetical protein [Frankia canadensis]SOU55322.1 conserved hypothetical protein [Frankia canadensis]